MALVPSILKLQQSFLHFWNPQNQSYAHVNTTNCPVTTPGHGLLPAMQPPVDIWPRKKEELYNILKYTT